MRDISTLMTRSSKLDPALAYFDEYFQKTNLTHEKKVFVVQK